LIIDLKDIDNIAFSKLKDDEKRTENEDMFKEQKPYEKTNNFASS
jgi:hypothetical protein